MSSTKDFSDSFKDELHWRRQTTRSNLLRKRAELKDLIPKYECCYCGGLDIPQVGGLHLHEIIVSRQLVRTLEEKARLAIQDDRNCGFVHAAKCHELAEGGTGRLIGIQYLIKHEGLFNVRKFVNEMGIYLSQSTTQELRYDLQRAQEILEKWKRVYLDQ